MNAEKANRNRFNELIEASPNAMAIYYTRDLVIGAANKMMRNFFGKDEHIIGKTLIQAVPELSNQPFIALLQKVYDSGIMHHATEDHAQLVVDGKLQDYYFNYTYKPIIDSEGNTEAIIHSSIDVTEQVNFRKQLAEAQQRLTIALESAEIGTWDLNPLQKSVNWDQRCRALFGFESEEPTTYAMVLDCIHPDDKPKVVQAVANAIDYTKANAYDMRYRTVGNKTGDIRWVHCKGRAYFNEQKIAYRFAGTARDISTEVNTAIAEQQLLSLVSKNPDLMSITNIDGQVVYLNQAGRELLGVPDHIPTESLTANDFYSDEQIKFIKEQIIPHIHEKTGWQGVIQVNHFQTKMPIPCQLSYIMVKNPITGEIIGRGATARDLRPELKAKVEIQRLATIVDISEDFVNYTDMEGNTIYINASGRQLIGVDENNISSAHIYSYHADESSKKIANIIIKELHEHGKWTGNLELKNLKTGEIIPIHKQLFIIKDELTKQPIAIAGIARDLRKEIAAQNLMDAKNAELSQAIREMEFLANTVPAVVWTATPNGELDYINQRWYERSGVPIADSLGHNWTKTIHPEDLDKTVKAWTANLKTGNPYQIEFRLKDKTGDYRWWLVRALALTDHNGHITKWYGTNTDITEQKELERQKDNFLGVASHELKTPVTSIKAYAQVLEMILKRSGDTKNAELMGKMDKQINRLTNLIGNLLDVTKINTGKLAFVNEPFDFNALVCENIESIQLTSPKHEIITDLQFQRTVVGDRERISQVIINLLTNAIKYSPDANRIMVYTKDNGGEVQLCVQDFGIGLSIEKKDRVFEQFYRVSGNKEHTFSGLGLGLYISAEIVKTLRGRIWVNSVADQGSTFCFAIPVDQSKID